MFVNLKDGLKDYKILRIILNNENSLVLKGEKNGKFVVLKSINELSDSTELTMLLKREISLTKKFLGNKKIVQYVEDFKINDKVYLVTEYCNGGDLEDYLVKKKEKISEKEAIHMFFELIKILSSVIYFT